MAKKADFPKTIERGIIQRGILSFRVKIMRGGNLVDKSFDTLAEARIFRDLTLANAALDPNEEATFAARAKKVENKSFTFAQAIKKYRTEKSEKKKGSDVEGRSLDKIERWPGVAMPLYQFSDRNILELLEFIRTTPRKLQHSETVTAAGEKYRKAVAAKRKTEGEKTTKKLADSTVKRYHTLIHHIFQIAVDEWKKIEKNPCDSIPKSALPKEGKPRDRRLRGDEYDLLCKKLTGQAKVIFILLVETAMRRGEVFAMKWEHLDLKSHSLLIPKTKTDEARTIFLSDISVNAFGALPRGIKGKIIFIGVQAFRYQFRHARAAIGSPDLRIHDLRHEATSRFFEKGMGDIEASTMTGHKSLSMLKRYAHLKQEHILEKLNRPARS